MSQRPKLWMHRTPRFWIGLAILILLASFWVFAGFFHLGLERYSLEGSHVTTSSLEVLDGRLQISHSKGEYLLRYPGSVWKTVTWDPTYRQHLGSNLSFDFEHSASEDQHYTSLTIPLWPLPFLWALLWPLLLHLRDKKEATHFAAMHQEAPPPPD